MISKYMTEAIKEAEKAYNLNEVPVGCVVVKDGEIISRTHNTTESTSNAANHAEILAIGDACRRLGTKYLDECEMYVTLEPCAMCSGAIINARIKRLYVGIDEPKTGCCGSVVNLFDKLPNKTEIYVGISEDACRQLMKSFFKNKR